MFVVQFYINVRKKRIRSSAIRIHGIVEGMGIPRVLKQAADQTFFRCRVCCFFRINSYDNIRTVMQDNLTDFPSDYSTQFLFYVTKKGAFRLMVSWRTTSNADYNRCMLLPGFMVYLKKNRKYLKA